MQKEVSEFAAFIGESPEPLLLGHCPCATQRFVRMVLDHPETKLTPHLGLAHAFDDLDTGFAQDASTPAVDTWVRVAHAETTRVTPR